MTRSILISAIVLHLIVIGCVVFDTDFAPVSVAQTGNSPAGQGFDIEGLPFRGVGFQIQRVDWIDRYKQSIDEIAEVGADTVLLVVDARQENGSSNRIYLDMRMTPTPEMLADLIRHAKSKGLRVMLMPIVLLDAPRGNEWRGNMKPESWEQWFESYRDMIAGHFAWIAEVNEVDVLVVGSELVTSENKVDEWTKTIQAVRERYKGKITYSANWDHYTSIPFWDQLDLIGMNSYYKMGEDHNVSVDQIVKRWGEIQSELFNFQKKVGKPLIFTEVGWCSLRNAAHEPWDYTRTELSVDLELQRKLYEGFFLAWHGKRELGGFMVWEWTPGEGGRSDKGYTPENKPAEGVLREWMGKPWNQ